MEVEKPFNGGRGEEEELMKSYLALHITKLVIKPCLVGIVDYILIQQNTGKLTEEIFKMTEMVYLDGLKLGVKFSTQIAYLTAQTIYFFA